MVSIGIIGHGVVGKAVAAAFRGRCKLTLCDPALGNRSRTVEDLVGSCEFIFICVPTPMKNPRGGPVDPSILDRVMADLDRQARQAGRKPIVVIKSTIIPSRLRLYDRVHRSIRLVYSPEYLTERTARRDYLNADMLVVGGRRRDARAVARLQRLHSRCKPCPVHYCDLVGASILKYTANCFLALKVTFLNQLFDVVRASGAATTWPRLMRILHGDSRMGTSHHCVPGPDGRRGWGGKCFPKDLNAFARYARKLGCRMDLLEKAWQINRRWRQDG